MKTLIRIILINIVISLITCVNHIMFELQRNEDLCFSEYFSDKTLVIFTFDSTGPMEVKITDPDERIKFHKVS